MIMLFPGVKIWVRYSDHDVTHQKENTTPAAAAMAM